jgi:fructokinase
VTKIWTAGEVLIDLIPRSRGTGADVVRDPVVGGGPANTAKALARLGLDSYFLCGLSSDAYGDQQRAEFIADGVKLDCAPTLPGPSATAHVTLDENGGASYKFTFDGTATFSSNNTWLPDPTNPPAVLHVGTLGTLIEPSASALYSWAQKVDAPIVYDPNIRSSVEANRDKYLANVIKWAALARVVKLSDDDANWLFPEKNLEEVVKTFLAMGVQLVVVTLGADGILGFTSRGSVRVPGVKVDVVDTVGAGDTVGAIVVEAIVSYGIDNLHDELLEKTLIRAAQAAAITCSRAGAKPPTKAELDEC